MNLSNILFVAISLIQFGVGIYLYTKFHNLKKNGIYVKGRIIHLAKKNIESFGEKSMYYFPVFSFTDIIGEKHEVQYENGAKQSKFRVGQVVDIIYNKHDPSEIALNNNSELIFPILLFGLSIIFFLIGVL